MANVFNLEGRLGLNVAKFNSKLDQAGKKLNSFKARTRKATKAMRTGFKSMAGAIGRVTGALGLLTGASGAGILALGANASKSAREIQTLADTTASTTREVQGLTLAFKQYGLEGDDVGDVLNTLADRAQDAKDGMQSFIDDFALVGIEVDDLKGKRPAELFNVFADAVAKTEDPVKRQAAIVRILGDDLGRKLAPALRQGAAGFEAITREAERTGVIMSAGTIQAANRASKSMDRLKSIVGAGVTKVFAQLGPYINAVSEKLVQLINTGVDFNSIFPKALDAAGKAVGFVADAVQGLNVVWKGVKVVALGFTTAVTGGVNGLYKIIAKGATIIFDNLTFPLRQALKAASLLPVVGDKFKQALNSLENVKPPKLDGLEAAYRSQLEGLQMATADFKAELMEPMPSEAITNFIEEIKLGKVALDDTAAAAEQFRVKVGQAAIEDTEAKVDEFAGKLRSTLGTELKTALTGNFKDIGTAFTSMLQNMIIEAMAADLANVIGLGGGGGPLTSGGAGTSAGPAGWVSTAASFIGFDGGGYTGNGARSGGLDGKGGFLAMMHPQETVTDHTRGQRTGGNTYNINVNMVAGSDERANRKSASQAAREIKRQLAQV